MDLNTTYLGMKLRTPIVPSASPLSEDIDKIKQMEQAGASAIVLHSLFEEQTEPTAVIGAEFRVGSKPYLEHIRRAKSTVKIPIIASLNCTTLGGWMSYTRQIAEAGADALELNIYRIPTEPHLAGSTIEETYIDTVRTVRAATKIPLAVKLRPRCYQRHLSGAGRDQTGDGRRRRDHVVQRPDALRDHTHPADRNGPRRLAGAASTQILARTQGHHESTELFRPQRIRTGAIRARPFQLYFTFSDATLSTARHGTAPKQLCGIPPLFCHVERSETSLTIDWRTVEASWSK